MESRTYVGTGDGVLFVFFADETAAAFGVDFLFRPDDLAGIVGGAFSAAAFGGTPFGAGASFGAGVSFAGAIAAIAVSDIFFEPFYWRVKIELFPAFGIVLVLFF